MFWREAERNTSNPLLRVMITFKYKFMRAREMVQWLETLVALPEDPVLENLVTFSDLHIRQNCL